MSLLEVSFPFLSFPLPSFSFERREKEREVI